MSRRIFVVGALLVSSIANADEVYTTRIDDKAPHLRVGLSARTIGVGFDFSAPTRLNSTLRGRNFLQTRTNGPGDVGLFDGGPETIQYQNGSVGAETGGAGEALTTIASGSQLTDPGRPFPGMEDFPLRQVEFNSTGQTITTSTTTGSVVHPMGMSGLSYEDEEVAVGPYVQFVFPLKKDGEKFLNFFVGYSFYDTNHGARDRMDGTLGMQKVRTVVDTTYTYRYDYYGDASSAMATFPYEGQSAIFDSETFNPGSGANQPNVMDPSKSSSSVTSVGDKGGIENIVGMTASRVNVDLHEIPFAFECGRKLGKGQIALQGGLTANVVDFSATSRTDWYVAENNRFVASQSHRTSGTDLQFGGFVGLNYTCPITEGGRIYFEAHASYRWVDPVEATVGHASFRIDPSSWEGGLGIGCVY